jgi:hypothetical protein
VKITEIAIDPLNKITWENMDISVNGQQGQLFVAPDSRVPDTVTLFNDFIHHQRAGRKSAYERIGDGANGTVYATTEKFAIKDFSIGGDISYLRANVILAEGLKQTVQSNSIPFIVRGLEIHAAFVSDGYRRREMGSKCLWLMEFIEEVPRITAPAPQPDYQDNLYSEAIKPYGLTHDNMFFDRGDGRISALMHNLLVEQDCSENQQACYVKIDALPMGPYLREY